MAHCSFDLHFPDGQWCWASSHVFINFLYIFFGGMSSQILCLIYKLGYLSICNSFLVVPSLNQIYNLQLSPLFLGVVFSLPMVSFEAQISFYFDDVFTLHWRHLMVVGWISLGFQGETGAGDTHLRIIHVLVVLSTGPTAVSQQQEHIQPCGPSVATIEICWVYSVNVTLAKQVYTLRIPTREMHL